MNHPPFTDTVTFGVLAISTIYGKNPTYRLVKRFFTEEEAEVKVIEWQSTVDDIRRVLGDLDIQFLVVAIPTVAV